MEQALLSDQKQEESLRYYQYVGRTASFNALSAIGEELRLNSIHLKVKLLFFKGDMGRVFNKDTLQINSGVEVQEEKKIHPVMDLNEAKPDPMKSQPIEVEDETVDNGGSKASKAK